VADVCIVCCDGLTGLPDAIGVIWPRAVVQLCVVMRDFLARTVPCAR
jgi:transposase-like protein